MDDQNSLRVLLSTVDRMLAEQGVSPSLVSDGDKLLIAAQYVETGGEREKMLITIPPEDRNDLVPESAPDQS